ncbi:hypothetical protein D9M71_625630 [compost metagenome]
MAGLDGADRVIGLDAVQFAIPLQIHMLATAYCPVLTAHASLLGQQMLTLEPGTVSIDVAQRQCTVLAFTTQVQSDFSRQTGTQTIRRRPR